MAQTYYTLQMARARAVKTVQGSPAARANAYSCACHFTLRFLCLEMTGLFDNSLQLDSSESVIENVQRVPSEIK